jgi:uncharacterized protein YndB with AHSA1/START domain
MTSTATDREIEITRVVSFPRELVWKAWTTPDHLLQWWGPKGFKNTFEEIDVRPGGVWRFVMHGPDGVDYPNLIVFDEIVRPERITFMHGSGDPDERMFRTVATFEALASNETRITMRLTFDTVEAADAVRGYAVPGGNSTLDSLEEHLASIAR